MSEKDVNKVIELAEPYRESLDSAIARLATLPELEYEQCRKPEADALGIRVGVLDRAVQQARGSHSDKGGNDLGLFEPAPWPEDVDGDDLLDRLFHALKRHVVVPDAQARTIALWTVHAHGFHLWRHTPRLAVTSPEKGCGKTTLLDILSHVVPRGVRTESVSTAVIFRLAQAYRPVLLIDEVDTFMKGNDELRGVLNAGHFEGGRHMRCEGDEHAVRGFHTFAPAVLAGIGKIPDTLEDRSIEISLHRRRADERIEPLRNEAIDVLHELASQITRWVNDNSDELASIEPEMSVINREADNWRPLLAIANVAGGDWPDLAHEALSLLTRKNDDSSMRVQLLGDIRSIFTSNGKDRLPSAELVTQLHNREERPWGAFGPKEKPITARQLANMLRGFGIASGTIRIDETRTAKGYLRRNFNDSFDRYLPADASQRHNAPDSGAIVDKRSVTRKPLVTEANEQNTGVTGPCDLVTYPDLEDDPEERAAIQAEGADTPDCLTRATPTDT